MRISDCEQLFRIIHDEKAFRIDENEKKARKKQKKMSKLIRKISIQDVKIVRKKMILNCEKV